MAIPSAIIHNFMGKNISPYTSWCIKICRNNIFFRLEEVHSSEQKLVSFQKMNILFIENIIWYIQGNVGKKIWAKQESSLTAVWLKQDLPV